MPYQILSAIIGYLLGAIPFGYLIGRARGLDIRQWGSGATGGTNVLRTLGAGAAVLTGLGDLGKGALAAYAGYRLGGDWGYALAATAAVVGHSYPIWLGFRGGKGVAPGGGALLLTHSFAFAAGLLSGLVVIWSTRYVSLGSLVAATVICAIILLGGAPLAHKLFILSALLLVYVRHWSNIKRLMTGTENRFGQKVQRTG